MNDYQITGIVTPHDNDVLSGRGNSVNAHAGNRRFRDYVYAQREHYAATPKIRKPVFAKLIVNTIRNLVPPGRFLSQDKDTKLWSDIGDKKAWDKTRQALREKISILPDSTNAPTGKSKVTSNGPQTSAISSSSTVQLREMLVRQLSVKAALNRGTDTWQSENAGGFDSISSENSVCGGIMSNEESEVNSAVMKASPPKHTFTHGNRISSLKRYPRYPEGVQYDSIGTFSSAGLSLMTERTNRTSFSNATGISFATGSSNGTASCSSELVLKVKSDPRYNDVDMHDNSLFLEGILAGKEMTDLKNVLFSEVGNSELLPNATISTTSKLPDTDNFNNSLYLDGMVSTLGVEEMSGATLSKIKTSESPNTNTSNNSPFLNRMVQQRLGEKEMSGLTDAKSLLTTDRGLEDRHNVDNTEVRRPSNTSNALMMHREPAGRQMSGLSDGRSDGARRPSNTSSSLMSGFSDIGRASSTANAMGDDDLSKASCTMMSDGLSRTSMSRQNSLLRTSFSTFVPDIGEGDEDNSTFEGTDDASKQLSCGTLKSDEMMSIRSRLRSSMTSRRNLGLSNLDDLSCFSGRISFCENMSTTESGIFSMNDSQVEEWAQEANEWEKEAAREDIQLMQEELLQLEENCEEVDNLNEMSSMMSDTCLR